MTTVFLFVNAIFSQKFVSIHALFFTKFVQLNYYGLLFWCSVMSSLFLCFDVVFVSYVVFALCGRAAGGLACRYGWPAGGCAGAILATAFPWSACRVHLMSSLLGWACHFYSRNLPIPAFPWSAFRVHLMLSLLGWACHYYSRNLPIPTFPWSACSWRFFYRKNYFHKNCFPQRREYVHGEAKKSNQYVDFFLQQFIFILLYTQISFG